MTVDDFPVLRKWCRPFSSTAVDQIPVLQKHSRRFSSTPIDDFPVVDLTVDEIPVLQL